MLSPSLEQKIRREADRQGLSPDQLVDQWVRNSTLPSGASLNNANNESKRDRLCEAGTLVCLIGPDDTIKALNQGDGHGTKTGKTHCKLVGRPLDALFQADLLSSAHSDLLRESIDQIRCGSVRETCLDVEASEESTPRIEVLIKRASPTSDDVKVCVRAATDGADQEHQLRKQETRFQNLTRSLTGVAYEFVVRSGGGYAVRYVSQQASSLLGLAPEPECFYERFIGRVPDSHQGELIESIDKAVDEESRWTYEMPFTKPSGERIWLRGSSIPDRSEGELVFTGVLLEITDQKRRELRLRQRREKVEALYETTDRIIRAQDKDEVCTAILELVNGVLNYGGVVRLAQNGHLVPVWISPELSASGSSRSSLEIDGDSVPAHVFEAGETRIIDTSTAEDEPVGSREGVSIVVSLGEHGTLEVVNVEGHTTESFDCRLIEVLATYGTLVLDQIDHNHKLVEAKEEAQRASQMKSAMLENMSHELRTPLSGVIGFADIMVGEADGTLQEFAERIRDSGQRLLDTVEDVLHFAQLEGEDLDIQAEQTNPGQVVQQVIDKLHPKAKQKNIPLQTGEVEEELSIRTDPDVLSQIATQLIRNGIKFTEKGAGPVTVTLSADKDNLVLEVSDPGTGIPEDAKDQIFDPFYQVSTGLSREHEGAGLGLAITRQLVELMNGEIHINGSEGGTVATVRLPRKPSDRDKTMLPASRAQWGLDQLKEAERVLVIDRDPDVRRRVCAMLPEDAEVKTVGSSEQALTQLGKHSFDLILIDVDLQDTTDDNEVLKRIWRAIEPPVPRVVAITDYTTDVHAEAFRQQGFDGYVPKPLEGPKAVE